MKAQSTITLGVEPTDTIDGVKQMIEQREVSIDWLSQIVLMQHPPPLAGPCPWPQVFMDGIYAACSTQTAGQPYIHMYIEPGTTCCVISHYQLTC